MAKPKSREKRHAEIPTIIGHLQNRLISILKDKSILINELIPSSGIFGFTNCDGCKYSTDDETKHRLVLFPFRVANEVDYWFSLTLEYSVPSKKTAHISIILYSDDLIKLFRAEWANNSDITHAQPHWHIHSLKPSVTDSWQPEEVKDFTKNFENSVSEKIAKIHFAMCASWHKKGKHDEELSSVSDMEILNWIEGVLNYTNTQLTYLHDKRRVVS